MNAQVHPVLEDIGGTSAAIAAIAGVLIVLWTWIGRPVRREWKINRTFQRQFREDWTGEQDRPGVPGRPGVMASLAEIRNDGFHLSERVRKLERDMASVRAQVMFILDHRPDPNPEPPETEEG